MFLQAQFSPIIVTTFVFNTQGRRNNVSFFVLVRGEGGEGGNYSIGMVVATVVVVEGVVVVVGGLVVIWVDIG